MLSLLSHLQQSWLDGAIRTLEGLRRGLGEPYPCEEDPPPVTPYEIIYEGGKVRLRHYRAVGKPLSPPLLMVYALIKRPFILDLQPGRSVVEGLTQQGVEVYLIDWIPPTRADSWRGLDAYVNGDLVNAVRAVQSRAGVAQVSLLGYCLGGLLTTIYTALHPETVKNLITLALPLDMSVRGVALYTLLDKVSPETIDLLTAIYGNCPAWLIKAGFTAMAPVRLYLPLYLLSELREQEVATTAFSPLFPTHSAFAPYAGLDRNKDRQSYEELFALFEQWMNSDVPLAGQIFREVTQQIFQQNLLAQGRLQVGGRTVNLKNITRPILNIIGEYDRVVHLQSSLPLIELVGSRDKQNLVFPSSHIGLAVGSAAHKELWPQVGTWLQEWDRGQSESRKGP
jgi:polyhydroxyalkanoate synthase